MECVVPTNAFELPHSIAISTLYPVGWLEEGSS
jgi:hypothetical protein